MRIVTVLAVLALVPLLEARTAELKVGPGKRYARIEDASAAAEDGDTILVYPREDNRPYERVALFIRRSDLTIRAAREENEPRVALSGTGFAYTGVGSVPRAIVQFNKGTDHCILEGFVLTGAHNESHNAAGVRVNQANHVTVRDCEIHHNDMGIMSNGVLADGTCADLLVESCHVHHNGDPTRPGYNHNFYLGGTSVVLRYCDIHESLTGQNVKSRAHYTRVEYCYVHESSNREFDLVDRDGNTTVPNSYAVLLGNVIVKARNMKGNKTVIHFGQDGGHEHDGTIHLIHNTILTPYISPVVDLSAPGAGAYFCGNLVTDGGARQHGQQLVNVRNGATMANVSGAHNQFGGGFSLPTGANMKSNTNRISASIPGLFRAPQKHDYRLAKKIKAIVRAGMPLNKVVVPPVPGAEDTRNKERFVPPLSVEYAYRLGFSSRPRETPLTLGAYAWK